MSAHEGVNDLVSDTRNAHVTRREFLAKTFLAGGAIGLSGCCTVSPMPPADLPATTLVVDPHCHIFNGHDLDIFNYQQPHLPFGVGSGTLYAIAGLVRAVAPTGEEELSKLGVLVERRRNAFKDVRSDEERARAEIQFAREIRTYAAEFAREVREKQSIILNPEGDAEGLLRDSWRKRRGKGREDNETMILKHLDSARREIRRPAVWAFFEPFFHYRFNNATRLRELYKEVALFTPAIMDTDRWFQKRPVRLGEATPLEEQVRIYEHIAVITNGHVLPIFAFDPRHQAESAGQNNTPWDLVETSLRNGSIVGIKLYPPMGYRPTNNSERDTSPSQNWPPGLGGELDRALHDAFSRCVDEELCVMAHNNRSKESATHFKDNGNPQYWRKTLTDHPTLKLNLGHFGGMENKSGWRNDICRLMEEFAFVYGDVGAFSEIACEKNRNEFFHDLRGVVEQTPKVLDRLMYGSDFFMNGLHPGYGNYLSDWIASFRNHFPEHWEAFCGKSAATYLGLGSGKQRERLDRFIAKNGLTPDWARLVA